MSVIFSAPVNILGARRSAAAGAQNETPQVADVESLEWAGEWEGNYRHPQPTNESGERFKLHTGMRGEARPDNKCGTYSDFI